MVAKYHMTLRSQPDRPMCVHCGVLPARQNGISVDGYIRWRRHCNTCSKASVRSKGMNCHQCGFEAADACQMCVVDGMTICQNCNALRLRAKRKEMTVDATVGIWDTRL